MRYYLVKMLTNTAEQDGSSIAVYLGDDALEKAKVGYHQTLATFINADDVLYAVVQIINELGNVEMMEIVDHRPEPEPPEPGPEPEPEE